MAIAHSLLPEFDMEMANTRKTLERVPDEKFEFKPHPKSGSMGWLAGHLANLPLWAVMTLKDDSLDIAPAGGQPFKLPETKNRKQVLEVFDQNVADAKKGIAAATDEQLMRPWSLLKTGADHHDHAQDRGAALLRVEPHHSSPRADGRVFAAQRYSGALDLRPERG